MDALIQAIELIGLQAVARACGVSYQAVRKWQMQGRFPRTEWTGETDYTQRIADATGNRITRDALLGRSAIACPADQQQAA